MNLLNRYPSLDGRVVFITGGGSGIGAALVEAFADQGATVVFVDILHDESVALAQQLNQRLGAERVHFRHCDLIEVAQLQGIIRDTGERFGPIKALINNAAQDTRHDFRNVTPAYWNERININLRPHFFAAQAVYEQMKQAGGGSIINFGSMSWHECQGNMTGYTTSKAAVLGMTRGLARDMGADKIRVNTLTPGWVMTERQLANWVNEDTKAEIHSSQCLKEELYPEHICSMALFLASDDSRMCTAQDYIVDGGWI